jgi:DNA-binding CsgD family transcriptional regulator
MQGREGCRDAGMRVIDALTPDQLRMVKMTFTGASDKQIAYLSGTEEKTVKNALSAAYAATGAKNRPHLAALVWWEIEGRLKKDKADGN